jgi:hypothetical protein
MARIDTSLFFRPAFAYNGSPDSVSIIFKASLGMDTAYVSIGFTTTGEEIPVKAADFFLTGNSGQYTKVTFPVPYVNPTNGLSPDSGYIFITSADEVFGPLSSGSIEIDDISFKLSNNSPAPKIPNGNFNTWTSSIVDYPTGWATVGLFTQQQGIYVSQNAKTTNKYDGAYALELQGLLVKDPITGLEDTLPGGAITVRDANNPDAYNTDINTPSFPVSQRYKSFRGYIKPSLFAGDVAVAWANFFSADSVVGSAIYYSSAVSSAFIEFAEDINWDSSFTGIPDSATIALFVADSNLVKVNDPHSLVLFDQLRFDNWGASILRIQKLQVSVFPNPCHGKSTLKASVTQGNSYHVTITSVDGREVWSQVGTANTDKLYLPMDLSNLSSGTYTLQMRSGTTIHTEKIILTP